ncbi:MAG: ADP-glyceromanno-heptose 6-epimerase [Lentimicrobiaceae bacterium]|jgi:ADP-L-glycero-D-manno-heptose 6-epimerase|nr:ADP-glyceromanno-heptose 6-epimerase [Lentimicrobiaceae bacterium]
MIVVTGAAGFIASVVVGFLNQNGFNDLILVDDFSKKEKEPNFIKKKYTKLVERTDFIDWFEANHDGIDFVIHLGARTDTTVFDYTILEQLNVVYSKAIWNSCAKYAIPLIYASSAATYGLGEFGYEDNHDIVEKLKPLNPYGVSKNEFDKWVLKQSKQPPFWAGLKFFNVYGPNEFHKGRMASVIMHAYKQIVEKGQVQLFRSHRPDYEDGKQLRDFIYVKDVANVILFLMLKKPKSGIYNLGTGKARTFLSLVESTFHAMNQTPIIVFVDTPIDIRDKYQYFTEANITKLLAAGYDKAFTTLEEGVSDYVKNYLEKQQCF